jgi:hypothetical protein
MLAELRKPGKIFDKARAALRDGVRLQFWKTPYQFLR